MARPRLLPRSMQELVHWYERYISPVSLVAGFLADNYILLRRVDLWQSNALLFSYLGIAGFGIILINLIETGRIRTRWIVKIAPLIPVVVQFSFGGLFSGYLSLYSRSAAFPASWIFVVALAALLFGNERFVRLYVRLTFQVSLYFTVLFSFTIFFLPVVFRAIGPYMFLLSGLVSLIAITLFIRLLGFFVPALVKKEKTRIARSIAAIYLAFNVMYFGGFIPPLPLSLKDAGVYHAVTKQADGTYLLSGEQFSWWQVVFPHTAVVHKIPGEAIYVWSAIFAPSGLATSIVHEWQYYDVSVGKWITVSTLAFPINGGRDGGYRGYTNKADLGNGKWRINVKTTYGGLIGRVSFTVQNVDAEPPLISVSK